MSKQFVFSLLFKGDAASAKAAAKEAVDSLDQVSAAGKTAETVSRGNAAALEHEAKATRDAANAAVEKAKAEKQARDTVLGRAATPTSLSPENVSELRSRFVPLEAAQRSYAKELETVALAERAGALTAAESAAAQQRLKTAHEGSVEALRRLDPALRSNAGAMRLNAHESRNLMFQTNDTVQSLLLGMPPLQVLLQQGPQVTQIYGGVGNTFRALASAVTISRLAIGGTAAVALVGAAAWNGYLKSVKAVDTAAAGLGRGMAGTRQELEAAARAGAEAADISIKSARSMEAAFLRTGRIDSSNFSGIISMSKDFAATIGIEADAAGAALSDIFADPAKGADTLYRQYGLISAANAQLAKDLTAQNRHAEAQAVLIKALPGSLASAEDATTALGRAWDFVARNASNAGDAIGAAINKAFTGPSTEEQLAELRRLMDNGDDYTPYGLRYRNTDLGSSIEAEYRALYEDKARRDRSEELKKQQAAANRLTAPAIAIAEASPVNRALIQQRDLQNEIKALERASGASGLSADQQAEIAKAIEAKSHALNGLTQRQANQIALDKIDVQLAKERNPIRRAELALRQSLLDSADKEITLAEASSEAQRARNNVMAEAMGAARAQSADLATELEIRSRLNAQVATGVITSAEANRLLREELELHPLVAAAASAQGQEQIELNKIIAERRILTAALAEEDKRAQLTERLRDYQVAQADTLARLQLEAALIGQSDAARTRAYASLEAEQKIRELGISTSSQQADALRREAIAMAEFRTDVDRLSDAWGRVDSAASSAIDGMFDELLDGDIKGSLRSLAGDVVGMWSEMALKNPLKNAILGSNLPTMDDVGGLGGVFGRLFGGTEATMGLSVSAMNAASMAVTTPIVNLTAANINGLPMGAAGAMGGAGLPMASLPGSGDVQSQIWSFFAAKGLKPHQIAGIMGNVSAESGFNPLAVGDNGNAFGLFQHNDRAPALFNAIGGPAGLSNVQGQLAFVWQELMTTELASMKRLLASTTTKEATEAFVGFERPQGYTVANPQGAMHFDQRYAGAEAALAKFGDTTVSAQAQLGQLGTGAAQLGTGLQNFGTGLAGTLEGIGASYGPGGQFLGGLLGAGAKWLTGGFQAGGYTGAGATTDVAGVVHAEEYVFDAASTRQIGVANLEALRRGAMRGYREGGYVIGGRPPLTGAQRGASGATAKTASQAEQRVVHEINVSGTGDAQIIEGVRQAISSSLEQYTRDFLPGEVRGIVSDKWRG